MSYTLLEIINTEHAHIQFAGKFENQHVIWDAHLYTLQEYWREYICSNNVTVTGLRNFIEIGETGPNGLNLVVGLNIPRMDDATIQKIIVMINQYKRLHRGKHEYGELINFSTCSGTL